MTLDQDYQGRHSAGFFKEQPDATSRSFSRQQKTQDPDLAIYLTNAFKRRKLAIEEQPPPTWRPIRGTVPTTTLNIRIHNCSKPPQPLRSCPSIWPERRAHLPSSAFGSTRTSDAALRQPPNPVSARVCDPSITPHDQRQQYLLTVNYCCCLNYSDNYSYELQIFTFTLRRLMNEFPPHPFRNWVGGT